MQLQIYKYTEDFEVSENKLYLLMLFYISAEKSPNLRTNLIFCHGIFVLDPDPDFFSP